MMHLEIMVGKIVKQDVREWYPSTTAPLLPTMPDGLGFLCFGMCYGSFTTLSRTPNGVSNKHSCSDHIF